MGTLEMPVLGPMRIEIRRTDSVLRLNWGNHRHRRCGVHFLFFSAVGTSILLSLDFRVQRGFCSCWLVTFVTQITSLVAVIFVGLPTMVAIRVAVLLSFCVSALAFSANVFRRASTRNSRVLMTLPELNSRLSPRSVASDVKKGIAASFIATVALSSFLPVGALAAEKSDKAFELCTFVGH